MYTTLAWPSSAQQVGCLYIILPVHGFNYHQLASNFTWLYMQASLHSTLVSSPDPTCAERVWWHPANSLGFIKKFIVCCMHNWEPITNLRAKKVLCHRVEEAKNFRCCTTDCLFCNVIGGEKFLSGTLMKPEVSAGCHQTLSRRWGLGTRLTLHQMTMLIVRSWNVYINSNPLFHFCPNLARLPHYV